MLWIQYGRQRESGGSTPGLFVARSSCNWIAVPAKLLIESTVISVCPNRTKNNLCEALKLSFAAMWFLENPKHPPYTHIWTCLYTHACANGCSGCFRSSSHILVWELGTDKAFFPSMCTRLCLVYFDQRMLSSLSLPVDCTTWNGRQHSGVRYWICCARLRKLESFGSNSAAKLSQLSDNLMLS